MFIYAGFYFAASKYGTGSLGQIAGQAEQASGQQAAPVGSSAANVKTDAGKGSLTNGFPDESTFLVVAENRNLKLLVSPETGHFIVTDNRTGHVWRSFASPEEWDEKENSNAWNVHLRSPFMFSYVEFNVRKDMLKETNFIEHGGTIASFEQINNGARFKFAIPELGFVIPVEVRLYEDYVETRVLDEGLIDGNELPVQAQAKGNDPKARLASIRPYPFLGAVTSADPEGYLLIPDGSGALIRFRKDRVPSPSLYVGKVFGDDWAYSSNSALSDRLPVTMPVFGIKSGGQAMIGIIEDGAEYANVLAAPSKAFSQYNWVTPEFQYRLKYMQPMNTKKTSGIMKYSADRIHSDMSTRYYFMDSSDPTYADMAARYRQYLMDETGALSDVKKEGPIPLHLSLLGADTEKGFLFDSYLALTTTSEAKTIVGELNSLGIDALSIVYMGWQKNGYSDYGGPFPIASKLGGDSGMKAFIDYAHSKNFPVYLSADHYSFNNTGRGGFRRSRDGLRDQGQAVIDYRTWGSQVKLTFVSPLFVEKSVLGDLEKVKSLHADGLLLGSAIGAIVNADYNDRYPVTRAESRRSQERIFQKVKETLGSVQVSSGNSYTLGYAGHMLSSYDDYSKDLFVDEAIPFAQIAMHGLLSYSFEYANQSDDYKTSFLKAIEYGAEPSFIVTYAPTKQLADTYSLKKFYSTDYRDWTSQMVMQYQQFNEALGDVRDQFITGHRKLADGVYETAYSNGKRIIVNYNNTKYSFGSATVNAQDFAVRKGGD
ncbi:DUF5696 domain-containing protein [Cohnella soli]|uniref:DUF5696 domain-containing protein n=1 Tax=Cohnella soli TaxID=425005 RepID=A0ABW0HZN2_9BACL